MLNSWFERNSYFISSREKKTLMLSLFHNYESRVAFCSVLLNISLKKQNKLQKNKKIKIITQQTKIKMS